MEICQCSSCGTIFNEDELIGDMCPYCESKDWIIRDSSTILEIEEELEGVLENG